MKRITKRHGKKYTAALGEIGESLRPALVAVPKFLSRLAVERGRVQDLLPTLRSIHAGLYGTGKEAIQGQSIAKGAVPPESADQILAQLTGAVDEVLELAERIHDQL